MNVARLQPQPIHGREMADWIAALAVPDQLWLRRGAGGEIKQHRIVGTGRPVRRKAFREVGGHLEGKPALLRRSRVAADRTQFFAAEAGKFSDLVLGGDNGPRTAAV